MRNTGLVFTLKGDILSLITEYDFNETDSIDAKRINSFLDKMHFDTHAKCKGLRDRSFIENYYNIKAVLASWLKTVFLSGNPIELCKRIKLLIQEKRAGKISDMINREIVAINGKFLEYKGFTSTQNKKIFENFILIKHIIFEIS